MAGVVQVIGIILVRVCTLSCAADTEGIRVRDGRITRKANQNTRILFIFPPLSSLMGFSSNQASNLSLPGVDIRI